MALWAKGELPEAGGAIAAEREDLTFSFCPLKLEAGLFHWSAWQDFPGCSRHASQTWIVPKLSQMSPEVACGQQNPGYICAFVRRRRCQTAQLCSWFRRC